MIHIFTQNLKPPNLNQTSNRNRSSMNSRKLKSLGLSARQTCASGCPYIYYHIGHGTLESLAKIAIKFGDDSVARTPETRRSVLAEKQAVSQSSTNDFSDGHKTFCWIYAQSFKELRLQSKANQRRPVQHRGINEAYAENLSLKRRNKRLNNRTHRGTHSTHIPHTRDHNAVERKRKLWSFYAALFSCCPYACH